MADSEKVSSLPSERERFEAWYVRDDPFGAKAVERDREGNYRLLQAYSAWEVWQAASAGRQELLEALKEALMCLSGEYDTDSAHQHAMDLARAAIAKHGG